MKRYFASIFLIISLSALSGCYSQGSSAPAPTNVNVVAGDSSATLTWDMVPGVEYWIFKAAGSDISPLSCFGLPQCQIISNAVSPTVVSGLANGTNYAFTINGRVNGGKGGPGSPAVQAVPRLAGALWTVAATAAGPADLRGVTYGTIFVAAGNGGALFSSTDGMAWTAQISPTTSNLDAASFYGSSYVVAGAGGVILLSTDAINWTAQVSNTGNDLYAVSNYGAAGFVATGVSGTVIHSLDGITWTGALASNTPNPLYAVTYGNGIYAAVGAAGTLITSPDGAYWSSPSSISASDLKGIAYAPLIGTNGAGTFVAVGASGTIITSTDGGTTWAALTSSPFASTTIINSVTYGRQFVAVANDGSIFTSIDGLSWAATASTPANTAPLYAVTHGIYDYSAVGAAGLNTHSM